MPIRKWITITICLLCAQMMASSVDAVESTCNSLVSGTPTSKDFLNDRRAFTDEFIRDNSGKALLDPELAETLYNKSMTFRIFFASATGSQKFNRRLVTSELLDNYHNSFFSEISEPTHLADLRDKSLAASLAAHGLHLKPGIPAREILSEISNDNMDRFGVVETLANIQNDHPDIARVLSALKMEFNRNSHNTEVHSDFILSSRQLERYGSKAGFNSMLDFSRAFMKTDDNVFFFVTWTAGGHKSDSHSKDALYYGRQSWKLNLDYARKNGWISFYVMWPKDLANFAQFHLGVKRSLPVYDSAFRQLGTPTTAKSSISEWSPSTLAQATDFRLQLYRLDFTVGDFESLAKGLFADFLISKKQNWPKTEFEKYLNRLKRDKLFLLKVFEETLKSYGLLKMELKIPVGVPFTEIYI